MIFIHILLCIAYAVFYGLCGLLFIEGVDWLVSKVKSLGPIPPEMKQILQAMVAVAVFIVLLTCLFEGGANQWWDLFHLHPGHS